MANLSGFNGKRLVMQKGFIFLACLGCFGLSACSEVQPWERGNLAKDIMASDPYPLQSLVRQHNYSSREAAGAASSGASGGGCGCN